MIGSKVETSLGFRSVFTDHEGVASTFLISSGVVAIVERFLDV